MSKIDAETAELEFVRLCKVRRLKVSLDGMTKKDAAQFSGIKALLCEAIQEGQLTVDAEGLPTVHLLAPFKAGEKDYTAFSFKKPRAGTLVLTGNVAESSDQVERTLALLAKACGTSNVMAELDMDDLAVMEAVFGLFFAKRQPASQKAT